MKTMTAKAWKEFYRREREQLGPTGIEKFIERAPRAHLSADGAILFPHSRLSMSGELIAAAARAVVESPYEQVIALGVLHGAREQDAERVRAARGGDADAVAELRGVHGAEVSSDRGLSAEEFSLDSFLDLVNAAARVLGKPAPRIHCRYPFLTADDPATLPGIDELRRLRAAGAAIVATTDPVHHGIGYGTPAKLTLPRLGIDADEYALKQIGAQLSELSRRKYAAFLARCRQCNSDFRDVGPVLAELLHPFASLKPESGRIVLVDYSDVLDAPEPTWVAAALIPLVRC